MITINFIFIKIVFLEFIVTEIIDVTLYLIFVIFYLHDFFPNHFLLYIFFLRVLLWCEFSQEKIIKWQVPANYYFLLNELLYAIH